MCTQNNKLFYVEYLQEVAREAYDILNNQASAKHYLNHQKNVVQCMNKTNSFKQVISSSHSLQRICLFISNVDGNTKKQELTCDGALSTQGELPARPLLPPW